MSLPFTYHVALPPEFWPWDRYGAPDATQPVPLDRLDFQMERRGIVGYVCQRCVAAGVNKDDCRSPEWEWNAANVEGGIPDEVEQWMHEHAEMHREKPQLAHVPLGKK